jgi:hypothetical protein
MTPVYARIEAVSRPRLHLTDVIPAWRLGVSGQRQVTVSR